MQSKKLDVNQTAHLIVNKLTNQEVNHKLFTARFEDFNGMHLSKTIYNCDNIEQAVEKAAELAEINCWEILTIFEDDKAEDNE